MTTKPNNFQMQSRFGRYCDQKYQFLLSQDDKHAGKKQRKTNGKEKLSMKELDRLIAQLEPEELTKGPKHRKGKSESYVFSVQSREEFYKTKVSSKQKERAEAPPVGYYHPNFTPVEQSPKVLDFSKSSFSRRPAVSARSRPSFAIPTSPEQALVRDTPEPFSKQLSRPPLTAQSSPVNEKRFELMRETPLISTKSHRVVSPDIAKTLARSYWKFLDTQLCPEYKPDYEYVRPRLARNIDFEKNLGRKYLTRSHSYAATQEALSYSQVRPKLRVPDFGKGTSRPPTESGPLPSFMLQTSSRLGLTVPNDKALQMNNYSEAGFFIHPSDFSPRMTVSRGKGVVVSLVGSGGSQA